jgi:hypothetical protein
MMCFFFEFGCFNVRFVLKYASYVAIAASAILILQ